MSTIQPFTYQGVNVRTVTHNDEQWFVAADVCAVLGISNHRDAVLRLDADEKGVGSTDTLGGSQSVTIISEAGTYSLAMTSRRPEAKPFIRWLSHEVVPQIRKTGGYSMVKELTEYEQLVALAKTVIEQDAQLQIAAPKAEAYDRFMETDGLYSMEAAAKAIGYGRNVMFRELRRIGVLQGNNLPYQRFMQHFEIKMGTRLNRDGQTVPTATTMVKPSGVRFLGRKLAQAVEAVEAAGVLV